MLIETIEKERDRLLTLARYASGCGDTQRARALTVLADRHQAVVDRLRAAMKVAQKEFCLIGVDSWKEENG